jgi:hypothetical protein
MSKHGSVIAQAIVHHYGHDQFPRRLAHPFWFQSFGAVMGMDWHSSGIATSVIGALKRGLSPLQGGLESMSVAGEADIRAAHQTSWRMLVIAPVWMLRLSPVPADLWPRLTALQCRTVSSSICMIEMLEYQIACLILCTAIPFDGGSPMATPKQGTGAEGAHFEAALGYLNRGWSIVPAGERTKRPIVQWQVFQHRRPSEQELTSWFERWPNANLAVITGAISGIVVVDVDCKHDGESSLAAMEKRHGALPATVEAVTGGGGRHIYFSHPGRDVRNRVGLAPGVDMRGDGGCVIVPPSIHPSGKRYRWKPGHTPGQIELAPLPVWLEEPRFSTEGERGHPSAYWRALVKHGIKQGQRNSTIASFAGHLLWHGVDPDVVMELMLAWNRVRCLPPLDDDEVIRTVASIERTHGRAHPENLR